MSEVHEPDRPAILAHDGTVLSRGELSSSVIAGAAFLKGQGVGRSDRLALSLAPGPARATGLLSGMAVATVAPLVHYKAARQSAPIRERGSAPAGPRRRTGE